MVRIWTRIVVVLAPVVVFGGVMPGLTISCGGSSSTKGTMDAANDFVPWRDPFADAGPRDGYTRRKLDSAESSVVDGQRAGAQDGLGWPGMDDASATDATGSVGGPADAGSPGDVPVSTGGSATGPSASGDAGRDGASGGAGDGKGSTATDARRDSSISADANPTGGTGGASRTGGVIASGGVVRTGGTARTGGTLVRRDSGVRDSSSFDGGATDATSTPQRDTGAGSTPDAETCVGDRWFLKTVSTGVTLSYGTTAGAFEYAAFSSETGVLRLTYGPTGNYGAQVRLTPVYVSDDESLHQDPTLEIQTQIQCTVALIQFNGEVDGFAFQGLLRLDPPSADELVARVVVSTFEDLPLSQTWSGGAFMPITLQGMRASRFVWTVSSSFAGETTYPIPASGALPPTPVIATRFGLVGGTSNQVENAPTLTVDAGDGVDSRVNGVVLTAASSSENNVYLWAATSAVPESWSYTVTATRAM